MPKLSHLFSRTLTLLSDPQPAQMKDEEQIETHNISIPSDKIGFVEVAHIDALNLPTIQKELIKLADAGRVKMGVENIIRIWQIDKRRIPGLKKKPIFMGRRK